MVSLSPMWSVSELNGNYRLEGSTPDSSVFFSSSGRLFCIRGRSKHFHDGIFVKESPFEVSLDGAKIKKIEESLEDSSSGEFKNVLHGQTKITIEATDFDKSLSPISALSLTFIIGQFDADNVGCRTILLCKGTVEMFSGQSYVPGQRELGTGGATVEHVIDRIILFTAQVEVNESFKGNNPITRCPEISNRNSKDAERNEKGFRKYKEGERIKVTRQYIQHIPSLTIKLMKIMLLLLILLNPNSLNFLEYHGVKNFILKLMSQNQTFLMTTIISYLLIGIQILFWIILFLIYIATPLRWDFVQDIPIYFNTYFRSILSLPDEYYENTRSTLSFFVHGWNAWGFCGAVRQGHIIPMYSMPHVCVQAFHSGGPALNINFGCGTDVRHQFIKNEKEKRKKGDDDKFYSSDRRDYIASDMFAILSNTQAKNGIICGFLSQKEQFGCIAMNRSYDHMSVHIDCDGAVCNPDNPNINKNSYQLKTADKIHESVEKVKSSDSNIVISSEVLKTDWFFIQLQDQLDENPLGTYLELSGRYNKVQELFASKEITSNISNNNNINTYKITNNNNNDNNNNNNNEVHNENNINNSNSSTSNKSFIQTKNVLHSNLEENREEISFTKSEIDVHGSISTYTVGVESVSTVKHRVPSGWCSWYHFFEFVSEKDLTDNIDSMHILKAEKGMHTERLGFNLFQVDDGYQSAWGDWLSLHNIRFPSQSMNVIVDKIKAASMTPGLWMAPFACDLHSQLGKNHPDWILKRKNRFLDFNSKNGYVIPANSANCGKWFWGLDVTNPEVQNHIKKCITTATLNWGYEYLKLDFLYVAALSDVHGSYYNQKITRAKAMQIGMKIITESMGKNVFLLGCGAPIGSVLGNVHANRVSSDAGLSWYPDFPLPYYDKWNLPCARNMVRNSINRMVMHGKWWINDPDCILLRTTTHYTNNEILGIATIKAMSGGSFIISDDLNVVPMERMRLAQQLLPATNIAGIPLDLLEKECPEIIRLQLGKDRSHGGGITTFTGSHIVSCLNNWTVLADCNWGEKMKSHYVTANYLDLLSRHNVKHNGKNEENKEKNLKNNKKNIRILKINPKEVKSNLNCSSSSTLMERHGLDLQLLHIFEFWSSTYSHRYLNVRAAPDSDFVTKVDDDVKNVKNKFDVGIDTKSTTSNSTYNNISRNVEKEIERNVLGMDENLNFCDVKIHSANIYILRLTELNNPKPSYIGSNLHFTCGLEVQQFSYHLHNNNNNSNNNNSSNNDNHNNNNDKSNTNSNNHIHMKSILKAGSRTSTFQNSCTITFEHSAVRCEEWSGYCWIFLPTLIDPNKGNKMKNKKDKMKTNKLNKDHRNQNEINSEMENVEFCDQYIHISGSLKATEKPKLIKYLKFPNILGNKEKEEEEEEEEDKEEEDKEEEEDGIGCVWCIPVARKSIKDNKTSKDRNMESENDNENDNDNDDEKDDIHIYW